MVHRVVFLERRRGQGERAFAGCREIEKGGEDAREARGDDGLEL